MLCLMGLCARSALPRQHTVLEESVPMEAGSGAGLWTVAIVLSLCWFCRLSFSVPWLP